MKRGKGYIGVFDSGFGGLSVLKEITKALPHYRYVYLGDSARAPYGTRSAETVDQFTFEAVDFLFDKGCELVIIACNTASAESLRQVQQRLSGKRRVLGVIVPMVEEVAMNEGKRIGVLATSRTVLSDAYPRELKKRMRAIVFQQAAPLLVPLIEEGEHRSIPGRTILKQYLQPLLAHRIDTLILGCTHYGHLEAMIRTMVPKNIRIISGGKIVSGRLKEYLSRHKELETRLAHGRGVTFYSTDLTEHFNRMGSAFYGSPVKVRRAKLGKC